MEESTPASWRSSVIEEYKKKIFLENWSGVEIISRFHLMVVP